MYIPNSFKNSIAKTFYDKSIDIYSKTSSFDAEGDYKPTKGEKLDSFMGNASFSNFKAVKEEYGIDYDIDISITTGTDNNSKFALNDLIEYQNITYEITDKIVCDSHILVVGKKWE